MIGGDVGRVFIWELKKRSWIIYIRITVSVIREEMDTGFSYFKQPSKEKVTHLDKSLTNPIHE